MTVNCKDGTTNINHKWHNLARLRLSHRLYQVRVWWPEIRREIRPGVNNLLGSNHEVVRELAARAKRMFSGPRSRPRDAIAKRSRITVAFLVTDPHTKFQRLATNITRGGRPRIRTHFDFNIITSWLGAPCGAHARIGLTPAYEFISLPLDISIIMNSSSFCVFCVFCKCL